MRILYHVRQCFGWGGVEQGKYRSLALALLEVTFMLLHWSLLGGLSGGGDDNVLDSTIFMVHVHEVTYVLRCALFLETPSLMTLLTAFAEYRKDR